LALLTPHWPLQFVIALIIIWITTTFGFKLHTVFKFGLDILYVCHSRVATLCVLNIYIQCNKSKRVWNKSTNKIRGWGKPRWKGFSIHISFHLFPH
jgi:hypothetical protein